MLIITRDEEKMIAENGVEINVIPAWKWLLQLK
jgi:predicted AAA+ superfamily ATPase